MHIESKHINIARLAVFSTISFFSVIVLALSAHWISATETKFFRSFYDPYAALALAVSLLSLLTLPAILIIGRVRKGAIISTIAFELSWLGILTILWLAAASYSSRIYANSTLVCLLRDPVISTGCKETRAIVAFAHLNWLWLIFYVTGLTVLAIKSQSNGKNVWHLSVKEADFGASHVSSSAVTPGDYEFKGPVSMPQEQPLPNLRYQSPPQQGPTY